MWLPWAQSVDAHVTHLLLLFYRLELPAANPLPLSLYRIFVFHVCAHARRAKCKHTHVGQAFLKLPLQFRTSWLQLQPCGPTMDFHHALTPFTKGNDAAQTQVDQPDLGMFVEVRVREHPPRWIRGKYVHWGGVS